MIFRIASAVLTVLLLAACAGRPVPLAIEVPPVNNVQLPEVVKAPADFKGVDVRWGGTILASERRGRGLRIEVLQRFFNEDGKPDLSGPSDGRFLVDIAVAEKSDDYSRGRLITVAGALDEPVKKQVNEQTTQTLPLIEARQHYTWRNYERDREYSHPYHYRPPFFYYYGPYYYHPFYPYDHWNRPKRPPKQH